MSDLVLERDYPVSPEHLFKAVTDAPSVAAWFGPEGAKVVEHDISLDRLGPWFARVSSTDGRNYAVSGVVTKVDAPRSVVFTWAWHDENDKRGHESSVRFSVSDMGAGISKLTITHSGLVDAEQVKNHNVGWSSSLTKLPKTMGL